MPGKAEAKPKAAKTKKPAAEKNKGGRPFALELGSKVGGAKLTVGALLQNLGSIFCTIKEAASVLGVSEPTIHAFFERIPEAREIFERGLDMGRVSLRRNQMALSKTNATMGIFLGYQYLGQKDHRNPIRDPGLPIDENTIANMPMEQLVVLLARIEGALASQPAATVTRQ